MKRAHLAIGIVLLILVLDQWLKIWVKTNMQIGDSFNLFGATQDWAQIYFVENPGMAFGLSWGGGKMILSLFRLVAIGFIIYYLRKLIIQKRSWVSIAAVAMILAGATGNLLDNMFYGLLFGGSKHQVAEFVSFGTGYAGFLLGNVVDMFYFPMVRSSFPEWFPIWGGQNFEFFSPIFNVADSSVFCGVVLVIIFYKQFVADFSPKKEEEPETTDPVETTYEEL